MSNSTPIGFAPIGINKIYNPLGELPVAKAAQELNLPYCLSTAGSTPIEDVAAANGEGVRLYQLYMPHDDELTISLLTRAHDSGFTACILTLDTWQLAWRHHDTATSNFAFYHGIGADLGFLIQFSRNGSRKRELILWSKRMRREPCGLIVCGMEGLGPGRRSRGLWSSGNILVGASRFVLKGIQSVVDAKQAAEYGVDGIVVSNHAGRQVDGAVASLDALEKIVADMFRKPISSPSFYLSIFHC